MRTLHHFLKNLKLFLPMKTWKKTSSKVAHNWPFFSIVNRPQNQPKSLFLIHKNCSPHDLLIMTLVSGRTVGSSCWSTHTFASCYWRNDPVYKIKNGFWKTLIRQSVHAFPISRTPNGTGPCPQVFPAPYLPIFFVYILRWRGTNDSQVFRGMYHGGLYI